MSLGNNKVQNVNILQYKIEIYTSLPIQKF